MDASLPEHDGWGDAGNGMEPGGGAGELAALLRGYAGPVRWWKPSIATAVGELGAWWSLVVVVSVVTIGGGIVLLPIVGCFAVIFFKVVLLGAAAFIAARSKAIQRTMAARREPFCIHCGYSLGGLADHGTCPECGMAYSFNIVRDFRRDPDWFIKRFETTRRDARPS